MVAQTPLIEQPRPAAAEPRPTLLTSDWPELLQIQPRVTWTFCAACGCDVATVDTVPHYRGGGNSPLCPSCADPTTWVRCDVCGQGSPHELMIIDPQDDTAYCPCVPVADLEFLRRAAEGALSLEACDASRL